MEKKAEMISKQDQTDTAEDTQLFHYTKSNQKKQIQLDQYQESEDPQVAPAEESEEEDLAFSPLKANLDCDLGPQTDRNNEDDQIQFFRQQNAMKNVQMGSL